LKVDINDDSVDNELLPINITAARNDGTQKTTTLKVHVEGSAYDDFNINLTN
jgi:DNA-binding protein YbaB